MRRFKARKDVYKRQAYYSWDTSKEAIEARTTEISKYLTKELQDLNADTIRTDIPTSATVTNVLVWNVKQSGTDDFTVAYEVDQQVKEGEQTQAVTENYTVTVHVDKDGAMAVSYTHLGFVNYILLADDMLPVESK